MSIEPPALLEPLGSGDDVFVTLGADRSAEIKELADDVRGIQVGEGRRESAGLPRMPEGRRLRAVLPLLGNPGRQRTIDTRRTSLDKGRARATVSTPTEWAVLSGTISRTASRGSHSCSFQEITAMTVNYVIDITDSKKSCFSVRVSLPDNVALANKLNSRWEVLNEGFLSLRWGGCVMGTAAGPRFVPGSLYLFPPRTEVTKEKHSVLSKDHHIAQLNAFLSPSWCLNSTGVGRLVARTLGAQQGEFSWTLKE